MDEATTVVKDAGVSFGHKLLRGVLAAAAAYATKKIVEEGYNRIVLSDDVTDLVEAVK